MYRYICVGHQGKHGPGYPLSRVVHTKQENLTDLSADTAWRLLAPTATKEQDRTRDVCANGFTESVGVIERMRADQGYYYREAA